MEWWMGPWRNKEGTKKVSIIENKTVIMNAFENSEGSPIREVYNSKCLQYRIGAISHK